MARTSGYSPEKVGFITQAIRLGATYELAAGYAGISVDTLDRWRKKYADFADKLKQAEGQGAVGWLAKIEKAANEGSWQAAAWKLERRYPEQYGRQIVDHKYEHILRQEAERIAEYTGKSADELLLEAKAMMQGKP